MTELAKTVWADSQIEGDQISDEEVKVFCLGIANNGIEVTNFRDFKQELDSPNQEEMCMNFYDPDSLIPWYIAIHAVEKFNTEKGYGFIAPDEGGKDVFVHISAVERAGLTGLADNQKVSYELDTGRNGKESATNLALA